MPDKAVNSDAFISLQIRWLRLALGNTGKSHSSDRQSIFRPQKSNFKCALTSESSLRAYPWREEHKL